MSDTVRAAGGVVFRRGPADYEILVVHRPRYDDWSLPKGKYGPDESPEQAALREIEEETGVRGRIVCFLTEVAYPLEDGREKRVQYYALQPETVLDFRPNDEVDHARWLTRVEASKTLSYLRDRRLVESIDFDSLAKTGTIHLVRHAAAGNRSAWVGDDRLRPLTPKGVRQARALIPLLDGWSIDRIISSPYVRCVQTVEPLASARGLQVEEDEALAEGSTDHLDLFRRLAGWNAVLCSHGDVIPDALDRLAAEGMRLVTDTPTPESKKGSTWMITVDGGTFVQARYLPPPDV